MKLSACSMKDMCPKWQANSLHFNVYRHVCKLDMEEVIAKRRWCHLNENSKNKNEYFLNVSQFTEIEAIISTIKLITTEWPLIKYVLLTGSLLHTALYNIISLVSSHYVHNILRYLNYLRLLTLKDLSKQLLIGQVIVRVSWESTPLITLSYD